MNCNCGCSCPYPCYNYSIILDVFVAFVLAITVGLLYYFALIPTFEIALWILLGLAGLLLILYALGNFAASFNPQSALAKCLCLYGQYLLIGIIGTIIALIAAFSAVIIPLSVAAAIIIGIVVLFAVIMIIELIRFFNCVRCRYCNLA
jgi:hypothetical protein